MSWFTKLIGVDKAVEKALEERGLGGEFLNIINVDERFAMLENQVQYQGNTNDLIRFYKSKRPKKAFYDTKLFWRVANQHGNLPIQHFPLASMITKAKVSLVFSEAPTFNFDKDEIGKEWEDIAKANHIKEFLKKAAAMRSYSGSVAIVPVIDPDFSDRVILRAYPKERYQALKKYDATTEVIVYEEYQTDKNKKFVLAIKYGKGSIGYALMNDKGREVPLSSLEETKDLKDQQFATDLRLFAELDGRSDYFGIIDDFSALDEAYSALTDLVRKGHIKTYYPKAKAVKGENGQDILPDEYTENVQFIPMANPTNAPYKIERDVVSMGENVQALTTAFNETLHHALITTGVSPATMGLDLAGANSSGEALNIRERQSMRTRSEMIGQWTEVLEHLAKVALFMDGHPYEGDVGVQFSEYESPTFDQKVKSLGEALTAGLIDRLTALRMLYPEKTEDEIEEMVILIEGGLPKSADDIMDDEETKSKEGTTGKEEDEKETNKEKESDPGVEGEQEGDSQK